MSRPRTLILASIVWVVFFLVSSAPAAAFAQTESFESGFGAWVPDAQVPIDPNTGQPVAWHIVRSTVRAFQGIWSLEYYLDGRQDDGTIWVERTVPVGTTTVTTVHIDFYMYSAVKSNINAWAVVAYAGVANPETESQFAVIGYTNYDVGWLIYRYDTTVTPGPTTSIWVAFGYSVRWETIRTDYFDYVTVTTS